MVTMTRHRDGLRPGALAMPSGTTIASCTTYAEAQRAVDHLADNRFPVTGLTIVGNDVHIVETVTGRLTWTKVLAAGGASGIWTGLFIGLLVGLLAGNPSSWIAIAVGGVLLGGLWGLALAAAAYAATAGQRDFTALPGLSATQFEIVADCSVADQARQVLAGLR